MEQLPRSGSSLRHVSLFLLILVSSSFGYVVYNTGLFIGYIKPSTTGIVQCAQSFGTIGCPDTVNGLFYVVFGALTVFAVTRSLGYGVARKR